jgi:hypothetical protein
MRMMNSVMLADTNFVLPINQLISNYSSFGIIWNINKALQMQHYGFIYTSLV